MRAMIFFFVLFFALPIKVHGQQSKNQADVSEAHPQERLAQPIDMSLTFQNQDGVSVSLSELVSNDRPLLLTLNYFRCTTMCTYQFMNLAQSLQETHWVPGESFSVASVSFDPTDTVSSAKVLHDLWLPQVGQSQAAWSFLVGSEENSKRLAESLNFYYKKEDNGEYSHVGGLFFITPEGVFQRYLYGIVYEPRDIKYALADTSNHKLGSFLDHLGQYFYTYDAVRGRYLCRFDWLCFTQN